MYVINFCHFVVSFGKVDDKFSIKFRKKKICIVTKYQNKIHFNCLF